MPSCARWRAWISPVHGRGAWRAWPRSVPPAAERPDLRPVVAGRDAPHRTRARAHHQRLGRRARRTLVAHALQDVAVGDTGGGEEAVVAPDEVVDGQHLLEVIAGVERGLALLVVARPQPAEQLAADALKRRGRDHALGGPADSPQHVDGG